MKKYYYLTKPGIVYSNALTGIAGFLLAAQWHIDIGLLLAVVAATMLIIAAGCIVNNYFDRDMDAFMDRTKKRALVRGTISPVTAWLMAISFFVVGMYLLLAYVNTLTAVIGLVGFIDYACVYTYLKRRTSWATEIGSISGATSIIAGYCAVTNRIDAAAIILFLSMVFLQMPHFYAIAIYRLKDYKAAHVPVLPAVRGLEITKRRIVAYIVAFTLTSCMLTVYGYTGIVYVVGMTALGIGWLRIARLGFSAKDDVAWARRVFKFSLLVILGFAVMIPLGTVLP